MTKLAAALNQARVLFELAELGVITDAELLEAVNGIRAAIELPPLDGINVMEVFD